MLVGVPVLVMRWPPAVLAPAAAVLEACVLGMAGMLQEALAKVWATWLPVKPLTLPLTLCGFLYGCCCGYCCGA